MEAFAERIEADASGLPAENLFEGVEGFRSGTLLHEVAEEGDAEGSGVLAGEVGSDDVIAAGAAFKNSSIGCDEEIVADVGPPVEVDVEGPDGADPGGVVADGAVGGVVDDEMGDGGVGGVVAALLVAIGTTPFDAGDDARAGVFGLSAVELEGGGDAGVDDGKLEGVGFAGEGFELDPALAGAEPEERGGSWVFRIWCQRAPVGPGFRVGGGADANGGDLFRCDGGKRNGGEVPEYYWSRSRSQLLVLNRLGGNHKG